MLINVGGNFEGYFLFEINIEESLKGRNEIVKGIVEEKEYEIVEIYDVVFVKNIRDGGSVEKGKDGDSECVSFGIDLMKFKNFFGDDFQLEVFDIGILQFIVVVILGDVVLLEIYFEELEDDMFGWDSNEDESIIMDIEIVDGRNIQIMVDEKICNEFKEDMS